MSSWHAEADVLNFTMQWGRNDYENHKVQEDPLTVELTLRQVYGITWWTISGNVRSQAINEYAVAYWQAKEDSEFRF